MDDDIERPRKRLRSSPKPSDSSLEQQEESVGKRVAKGTSHGHSLKSLSRSVTPPPRSRARSETREISDQVSKHILSSEIEIEDSDGNQLEHAADDDQGESSVIIPSPIKLTYIRDLAPASGNNNDTVRLRDILGDPMIRECWQFNYLFDVDFLMSQFDEDVRALVQVKVVHGSWKKEAPNRIRIDEACTRYPNVEAITAYMPEPFGTHHSKMMILLRHDDLAQVVIHTANMIPGDWTNMCQAVWRSPLLPLCAAKESNKEPAQEQIGSGQRFKRDLLAYLEAYGDKKTKPLIQQLRNFNFESVRAALIASTPSKQKLKDIGTSTNVTSWGWPALKSIISQVPLKKREQKSSGHKSKAHIVIQISSVASLGSTDKWLKDTLFASLNPNPRLADSSLKDHLTSEPKYSIIFPTPDEIRRSLDGYGSGGSIHMKLHNKPQQMQLQYMRGYLCHWAGDIVESGDVLTTKIHQNEQESQKSKREAGRRRAAPHIKTYIRFSDAEKMDTIDWAMVTSANLSTQAWGAAPNANGEVRICSWEIGVIVWPDLFAGNSGSAVEMVPCFKSDLPTYSAEVTSSMGIESATATEDPKTLRPTLIGFRMPYDLPLTPYSASEIPWCATARHPEPDWLGQTWDT